MLLYYASRRSLLNTFQDEPVTKKKKTDVEIEKQNNSLSGSNQQNNPPFGSNQQNNPHSGRNYQNNPFSEKSLELPSSNNWNFKNI